ncbi:MAG: hypothetical protein FJW69_04640 [Actinobacteria bacterium]|nr:hypothetical protein [Actinomycetota bacterium]
MVSTKVDSGICGFRTEINAGCQDYQHVSFKVDPECKNITELAQNIKEVDAFNEIRLDIISTCQTAVLFIMG